MYVCITESLAVHLKLTSNNVHQLHSNKIKSEREEEETEMVVMAYSSSKLAYLHVHTAQVGLSHGRCSYKRADAPPK